jgi:hypothetical protein
MLVVVPRAVLRRWLRQRPRGVRRPGPNAVCDTTCALLCNETFGDCNARADDGCECAPERILGFAIDDSTIPFPPEVASTYFMFRPELLADGRDLWFAESGFVFKLAPEDTAVQFIINPAGAIPDSGDFYFTRDVAQDDTFFFWTMNDYVARLNKVGEPSAILLQQGIPETNLVSIAVDDERIYFTTQFLIAGVEKDTPTQPLVFTIMGTSFESSIAVDDDGIYFSSLDDGKIGRCDKGGVPPDAEEYPAPTYYTEDEVDPRGLIVDDGFVYWGTGDGAIRRTPTAGGDIEELAKVDQTADNLVMKDGSLFWTAIGTFDGRGIVYRLRVDEPGAQPATAMRLDDEVENIAVGDAQMWANPSGDVFVAPLGD